ncbi:MAG: hypothetical protein HZA00_01795 [Nitrospinae bacterium]|nr:hypothetical protein [Nitrospinota bacterium]
MEIDKAKKHLAILWFGGSAGLSLLLIIQTILGHYADKYGEAWSWFLPIVMPTLSLIIGVFVSDVLKKDIEIEKRVDNFFYWLTISLSAVYILAVSLTLFLSPVSRYSSIELMKISNFWLGPLQGLVAGTLLVFFRQNGKK